MKGKERQKEGEKRAFCPLGVGIVWWGRARGKLKLFFIKTKRKENMR